MYRDWQKIILNNNLFWQYPVITEQEFYRQNKHLNNYVGIPWATILDKNIPLEFIAKILKENLHPEEEYFTCCQHIRFRELINLFKLFNIKTIFSPHKCLSEDKINDVNIKPCPLYAVNIEDSTKNLDFQGVNFLEQKRDIFYSFIGGLQPGYLTDIRSKIFSIPKKENIFIENTGEWHFNEVVYSKMQNLKKEMTPSDNHLEKTKKYNQILLRSRFSLCPSGTGPNSIRFWESLAVGAIPVLLADTLELPHHDLWEKSIVRIKESELLKLEEILNAITEEEEKQRRINCIKIYDELKNNFRGTSEKPIVHYCCGSYYQNNLGGVACYDYQLSLAFPRRIFFEGPRQKNELLNFLKDNKESIVITDNHLSCDIPNDYKALVVHHGVAQTHAEREPEWDLYWKNLCCSGQYKMLYMREPEKTKFISTSTFCKEEFTRHYEDDYRKFEVIDVLHSSEMDNKKFKIKWNSTPIVLGNWSDKNKGQRVIPEINEKLKDKFIFKSLRANLFGSNIKEFIKNKQQIYLDSDIFLQLSFSEGNSYATLDALSCGLPVVASNVGLFYKDVPDECFVKIDWKKNSDIEYIIEKINYAWENKESISKNAMEWYNTNCTFEKWKKNMLKIVEGY